THFRSTLPGSSSLSLSFYILFLMLILILIKWPYYLLLIVYLNVSPYLFIKLMSTNQMFSRSERDLAYGTHSTHSHTHIHTHSTHSHTHTLHTQTCMDT